MEIVWSGPVHHTKVSTVNAQAHDKQEKCHVSLWEITWNSKTQAALFVQQHSLFVMYGVGTSKDRKLSPCFVIVTIGVARG